jgi:hypothetical protein
VWNSITGGVDSIRGIGSIRDVHNSRVCRQRTEIMEQAQEDMVSGDMEQHQVWSSFPGM